jgi:transcriptional regulator with XRE-family HTH domain
MATYEELRRETRHRLACSMRRERERLGLTQERAAERVGISLQHFQRIEREIINVPLDTLTKIAHALRTEPASLLLI